MNKCQLCEADTGRHPAGTVVRHEPCGCCVAGIGLLPNPWHLHRCPLHVAAPALLKTLEQAMEWLDQHENHDRLSVNDFIDGSGFSALASAAIAQTKSTA